MQSAGSSVVFELHSASNASLAGDSGASNGHSVESPDASPTLPWCAPTLQCQSSHDRDGPNQQQERQKQTQEDDEVAPIQGESNSFCHSTVKTAHAGERSGGAATSLLPLSTQVLADVSLPAAPQLPAHRSAAVTTSAANNKKSTGSGSNRQHVYEEHSGEAAESAPVHPAARARLVDGKMGGCSNFCAPVVGKSFFRGVRHLFASGKKKRRQQNQDNMTDVASEAGARGTDVEAPGAVTAAPGDLLRVVPIVAAGRGEDGNVAALGEEDEFSQPEEDDKQQEQGGKRTTHLNQEAASQINPTQKLLTEEEHPSKKWQALGESSLCLPDGAAAAAAAADDDDYDDGYNEVGSGEWGDGAEDNVVPALRSSSSGAQPHDAPETETTVSQLQQPESRGRSVSMGDGGSSLYFHIEDDGREGSEEEREEEREEAEEVEEGEGAEEAETSSSFNVLPAAEAHSSALDETQAEVPITSHRSPPREAAEEAGAAMASAYAALLREWQTTPPSREQQSNKRRRGADATPSHAKAMAVGASKSPTTRTRSCRRVAHGQQQASRSTNKGGAMRAVSASATPSLRLRASTEGAAVTRTTKRTALSSRGHTAPSLSVDRGPTKNRWRQQPQQEKSVAKQTSPARRTAVPPRAVKVAACGSPPTTHSSNAPRQAIPVKSANHNKADNTNSGNSDKGGARCGGGSYAQLAARRREYLQGTDVAAAVSQPQRSDAARSQNSSTRGGSRSVMQMLASAVQRLHTTGSHGSKYGDSHHSNRREDNKKDITATVNTLPSRQSPYAGLTWREFKAQFYIGNGASLHSPTDHYSSGTEPITTLSVDPLPGSAAPIRPSCAACGPDLRELQLLALLSSGGKECTLVQNPREDLYEQPPRRVLTSASAARSTPPPPPLSSSQQSDATMQSVLHSHTRSPAEGDREEQPQQEHQEDLQELHHMENEEDSRRRSADSSSFSGGFSDVTLPCSGAAAVPAAVDTKTQGHEEAGVQWTPSAALASGTGGDECTSLDPRVIAEKLDELDAVLARRFPRLFDAQSTMRVEGAGHSCKSHSAAAAPVRSAASNEFPEASPDEGSEVTCPRRLSTGESEAGANNANDAVLAVWLAERQKLQEQLIAVAAERNLLADQLRIYTSYEEAKKMKSVKEKKPAKGSTGSGS